MILRTIHTDGLGKADISESPLPGSTNGIYSRVMCTNVDSKNDGIQVALSRIEQRLEYNPSEDDFREIAILRQRQYKKYPEVGQAIDHYDQNACILYGKNKTDEVTSTGRIVFDSPVGLPADQYAKSEIDKLRQQGLVIVEISKFAIAPEAKGALKFYLWAYYEIAIQLGIDAFVSINPIKAANVYKKIYAAQVLLPDIGYSYGTNNTFALLMHSIPRAKPCLSRWLGEELS